MGWEASHILVLKASGGREGGVKRTYKEIRLCFGRWQSRDCESNVWKWRKTVLSKPFGP